MCSVTAGHHHALLQGGPPPCLQQLTATQTLTPSLRKFIDFAITLNSIYRLLSVSLVFLGV